MIVDLCMKIIFAVITLVVAVLGFLAIYFMVKRIILDISEAKSWYEYFNEKYEKRCKNLENEV